MGAKPPNIVVATKCIRQARQLKTLKDVTLCANPMMPAQSANIAML